ncbi:unnamed protein product [Rotaria sordida]|uniref:Uncharacterized protein n=1 Tax=Rotaria sordida TaxID=392033 RepID=A0A814MJC0_9BILA|nr:unnamed protein product [Rotaria sordida]CAF1268325.1 unnamed protein product [Rotaria sordida]
MKAYTESCIRSSNLYANLSIITLYHPRMPESDTEESTKYSVSVELLESIGCRTIHVLTMTYHVSSRWTNSTDNGQTLESFIQDLFQQRKNMSDTDLQALKTNPCLTG